MPASSLGARTTSVTRACIPCQMQCGLARRVPAAGDIRFLSAQGRRLRDGAAVEQACSVEGLQRGSSQPAVARAGREDHGARRDEPAVGERHADPVLRASDDRRAMHEQEVGSKRQLCSYACSASRLPLTPLGKPR